MVIFDYTTMRNFFLCLLFLLSLKSSATESFNINISYGKVHFFADNLYESQEVANKVDIFLCLLKDFVHREEINEDVMVMLSDEYTYSPSLRDTLMYSVSYRGFTYTTYDSCRKCEYGYSRNEHNANGIVIKIRAREYRPREWLQLISAALRNQDLVKKEQNSYHIKSINKWAKDYDEMKIPYKTAYMLSRQKESIIDSLFAKKIYCGSAMLNWHRVYYFKDSNFYFQELRGNVNEYLNQYNINEVNIPESFHHKFIAQKWLDTVNACLVTKNILQINPSQLGDFVFINDSMFYFLSNKVKGPFTLSNLHKYSIFDFKSYCMFKPVEYVIMEIENNKHKDGIERIFFCPDSSLIVRNYDSLEVDQVKQLFRKFRSNMQEVGISGKEKLLIISFVCLSVLLSSIIFLRRRDS